MVQFARYRRNRILQRDGLDLDRSTPSGRVSKSTAPLVPLTDVIGRDVLTRQAIFSRPLGRVLRNRLPAIRRRPREDAGARPRQDRPGMALGPPGGTNGASRTASQLLPILAGSEG